MIENFDLSREQSEQLLELLEEQDKRVKYNYISTLFPEDEEAITLPDCLKSLARSNYPKHIDFFNAGANYTERAFIAGNRCGKTLTGLCELYWHCSGDYPKWWKGKRFSKPIVAWLCGDRAEVIRDGMQPLLMGHTEIGTGVIPLNKFDRNPDAMPGCPGGKGQYFIKHVTGGVSKIIVKTYQAGKDAFESAAVDVIMLDEEAPLVIYVEAQMRTATTGGIVYLTFTPDNGLTDTVIHFMDKPKVGEPAKFVTMVGWDAVPHLGETVKKNLLAAIPPHLRDVKTKGIPYLGAGAIYPILESEFVVAPFEIPDYWPRAYALDPGWDTTAALWGAYDAESDTWFLYAEYYRGQAEPAVHTAAIKARGSWIDGVCDPHGMTGGKGVATQSYFEKYAEDGLNLMMAYPSGPGSVDLGINEVYSRLSSQRIKVLSTMENWLYEYRIYRRNDKGQIVKTRNHLMDCTRYLALNGLSVMKTKNTIKQPQDNYTNFYQDDTRSSITGY